MTDEKPTTEGQEPESGQPQPNPQTTGSEGQEPELYPADVVRKLTHENAGHRVKLKETEATLKEVQAELKKLRKSQADDEQVKLEEQGKYKELAEKHALKLAETNKRLESLEPLQQKIEQYEKKFGELLEGQKVGLPDYILDLLKDRTPLDQLEWINQHKAQLTGQQPAAEQPAQQPGQQRPANLIPVSPTNPARSAAIQTGSLTQEHKDRLLGKKGRPTIFQARPDGVLTNTS